MYAGLGQSEASPPAQPGPLTALVQAFLQTDTGRAVQADVAGAAAPFLQASAQQATTSWWQQNQKKVLIGAGLAAVALVLLTRRR